jgi:1-acyl-sn-glycerol-3-phosphate acyltransferase
MMNPRLTSIVRMPLQRAVHVALAVAVLLWCRRFRLRGRENLPRRRPVLVVANHASHADTVLLIFALAAAGRRIRVAAAEDYWFRGRVRAAIASAIGAFPFPRTGDEGVERARNLLGRATVILFPQGSRTGGRFRSGVGRIVADTEIEVVPVHIDGSDRILPRGRTWPHRSDVTITIGRPTRMHRDESPSEFAERLERIVLEDLVRAA